MIIKLLIMLLIFAYGWKLFKQLCPDDVPEYFLFGFLGWLLTSLVVVFALLAAGHTVFMKYNKISETWYFHLMYFLGYVGAMYSRKKRSENEISSIPEQSSVKPVSLFDSDEV